MITRRNLCSIALAGLFRLFGNYRANDTYREVAPSHN